MNETQYERVQEDAAVGSEMARTVQYVLDAHGVESLDRLDRDIYKSTGCGASLGVLTHDKGYAWSGSDLMRSLTVGDVRALGVGTIIEGSDADIPHRFLDLIDYIDEGGEERYLAAFGQLTQDVDDEADVLWHEANVDES